MGWYMRKSFKIAPGVRLNLSTRGIGFSVGTRGARIGIGPRGAYVHAGAGGIYFRKNLSARRRQGSGRGGPRPAVPAGRTGRARPGPIPGAAGAQGGEFPAPGSAEEEGQAIGYPGGDVEPSSARDTALGCLFLVLLVAAFFYPVLWAGVAAMVVMAALSGKKEADLRDGLRRAIQALQAGEYARCLEELAPLLEQHPTEADLWLVRGLALYRAGRAAEAAEALLRIDEHPETLGRLAGRVGASFEIEFTPWPLRATLPSAPGIDLLQAHVLALAGRHEEALAQLDGVLELNPGFHPARFMKALVLFDRAERAAGQEARNAGSSEDYERAIALLQEIDADDPLYLWALAAMGQVFRESGHPDLAVEVLKRGTRLRRDPEAVKAIRYELALAYDAIGDRRRAREQLARIVAEDIGYRDAHKLLQQWAGEDRAAGGDRPGRQRAARGD